MNVLLDENLPHKLRLALRGHEIVTVQYLGWSGLKNGQLVSAAIAGGIEIFITGDRRLADQQKVAELALRVIVLSAINWPIVKDYLFQIQMALNAAALAPQGSIQLVDCGTFRRS